MDCFAIAEGELRYEVNLMEFPDSVEGTPLFRREYLDYFFHEYFVPLSGCWNLYVVWENDFNLVVVS